MANLLSQIENQKKDIYGQSVKSFNEQDDRKMYLIFLRGTCWANQI